MGHVKRLWSLHQLAKLIRTAEWHTLENLRLGKNILGPALEWSEHSPYFPLNTQAQILTGNLYFKFQKSFKNLRNKVTILLYDSLGNKLWKSFSNDSTCVLLLLKQPDGTCRRIVSGNRSILEVLYLEHNETFREVDSDTCMIFILPSTELPTMDPSNLLECGRRGNSRRRGEKGEIPLPLKKGVRAAVWRWRL